MLGSVVTHKQRRQRRQNLVRPFGIEAARLAAAKVVDWIVISLLSVELSHIAGVESRLWRL